MAHELKTMLGGAGNVVRNLAALGARVSFSGVVGDDADAVEIEAMLSRLERVEMRLIPERRRKTTVKTRFIADRQQIVRVDDETTSFIDEATREKALRSVKELSKECDAIIVSDYGKGFLSPDLLCSIIKIGREGGSPVLVDPKGTDYLRYSGANILTPNLKEIKEAVRMPVDDDESVIAAARRLIDSCKLDAVLVTRGKDGMLLAQSSGEITCSKAEAKEVFDVSGAGDTVIAAVAAALGAGATLSEASELANIAAGIVVGKAGTAVTYPKDIIQAIHYRELTNAEAL
jgi:D-beta-D-heptose 7-phosphate kinase/D-beta-D-heptose 1-phosphate adenosyltransferase